VKNCSELNRNSRLFEVAHVDDNVRNLQPIDE
jgi:hypothetical protein